MPTEPLERIQEYFEEKGRLMVADYLPGGKYEPRKPRALNNYLRVTAIDREVRKRQQGGTLVDFGCAAGMQTSATGQFDRRIGVEISQTLVDAGKRHYPNVEFVMSGLENIPLEEGIASAVLLLEVIEHVPDDGELLHEAKRLLKSGGYLYISTPNMNEDGTYWGRLQRSLGIRRFIPFDPANPYNPERKAQDSHVREYTAGLLRHVLEKAGLTDITVRAITHWDGPGKVEMGIARLLKRPLTKALVLGVERMLDFFPGRLGWGRCLIAVAKKP